MASSFRARGGKQPSRSDRPDQTAPNPARSTAAPKLPARRFAARRCGNCRLPQHRERGKRKK